MKIKSAVFGAHIAVVCAFSLTQGCLTTGTDAPGRGARHKGPFQHEHVGKSKESTPMVTAADDYGMGLDNEPLYMTDDTIDVTPVEPIVTVAPVATTETYIVRKGDTISQLAVDFDTTSAELVRLNNLSNPDVLYVGQELLVPAGRGASAKSSSTSSSSSVKKGGAYVIQKGDTLSEIAVAAGVSIDDLRKLNNIQGDMIMAGETIYIPAGGKVPTTTKKTSTKKAEPQTEPKAEEPAAMELPPMAPAATEGVVAEEPEGTVPTADTIDLVEERVVYPGETLDSIAREYGVSKAEIMRLNGITDETQVKDGQRLRIPISE